MINIKESKKKIIGTFGSKALFLSSKDEAHQLLHLMLATLAALNIK